MELSNATKSLVVNIVELIPAVQSLKDVLSCASCHRVIEIGLQIHSCGFARYCQQCSEHLSHCLVCDEHVAQPMKSLDEILAINGCSASPRISNILLLLQQLVDYNGHLQKSNRNDARIGNECIVGNVPHEQSSSDTIGNMKFRKNCRLMDEKSGKLCEAVMLCHELPKLPPKTTQVGNKTYNNLISPATKDVLLQSSSPEYLSRKRQRVSLQSTQYLHHEKTSRNENAENEHEGIAFVEADTMQSASRLESQVSMTSAAMSFALPSTCELVSHLMNIGAAPGLATTHSPVTKVGLIPEVVSGNGTAGMQGSMQCITPYFNSSPNTNNDFARNSSNANEGISHPSHPMTQSYSLPTLPDTMNFVRDLSQLKSSDLVRSDSRICPLDVNLGSTLSIDAVATPVDFVRRLSETSMLPRQMTVVAVESISRQHVDLFRKAEGQVQFVRRICRSTVDLNDSFVLPSHFLTECNEAHECFRTFEYLKAMALGLHIMDILWINDRDEAKHQVWGDSTLAHLVSELHDAGDSPYSWIRRTNWWGTHRGPCWSSVKRRESSAGQLLDGFVICILQYTPQPVHGEQSMLTNDEAELLCLLAGAASIMSLDDDRSCFERKVDCEKRILLVPAFFTSGAIQSMIERSDANMPLGAKLDTRALGHRDQEAIVLKESWLIDSISTDTVAPLTHYSIGVLEWK